MNWSILRVIPHLGLGNVASVALYRSLLKSGWYRYRLTVKPRKATAPFVIGPARYSIGEQDAGIALFRVADEILRGELRLFGGTAVPVGSPPEWFKNPLSGTSVSDPMRHWSMIGDFSSGAGDIKGIWEMSRFGWAVILARAFMASGEERYLRTLNAWVMDWVNRNPLNRGPNWKCGQEASLRMLHLLQAARILNRDGIGSAAPVQEELIRFVADHCTRIQPTLRYAMAQDNNHGTSEAAALFVGGAWLDRQEDLEARGLARAVKRWTAAGRRCLEDRLERLVAVDGSFSQYSVNYHRLLVDTLREVELWRQRLRYPSFSEAYRVRCAAAAQWLSVFTDPVSGDAPNVGGNDGSLVFAEDPVDFRDYRTSADRGLKVLAPDAPSGAKSGNRLFAQGGFVRMAPPGGNGMCWALIRFPRYRFRPSDSDPLHFDLWHGGRNLLRDGGSLSYNAGDPKLQEDLGGPKGHNTIQFDGRDPMPLLSRFLRSHWLNADKVSDVELSRGSARWSGRYTDHLGATHERTITAKGHRWKIVDRIQGFRRSAILRWRLEPGSWSLEGFICRGEPMLLTIDPPAGIVRIELVEGWEARWYGTRFPIPLLEVEVAASSDPVEIRTVLDLCSLESTDDLRAAGPAHPAS